MTSWKDRFDVSLAKRLLSTHKRVVLSVIIIIILGISIYMSPLRGNTISAVGVFAILNTAIITLIATVQVEIVSLEEDMDISMTSLGKQCNRQTTCFISQAGNINCSTSSPRTNMLERSVCVMGIQTTSSLTYAFLDVNLTA